MQRYDFAKINTLKTDEGFIVDKPIVGRIGIQIYQNKDGSIRRELRLPEHVFEADSLASFKGKPITSDHPGRKVTSKDVRQLSIGTVLSNGQKDDSGNHVVTEIVIHDPEAMGSNRELSLGYDVQLDETPGEWNGEKYDAIQTNIRVNHLAVVFRGRAGVARLNVDGNEDFETETKPKGLDMPKVRLDNGIEYEAPAEVAAEVERLRGDASTARTALAKAEAERDAAKTKADGLDAAVKAAREAGRADAVARTALETLATGFKIDSKGKTDRQVKEAVIKLARKNDSLDLSAKSDEYINAAFELACEETQNSDEAMRQQREAGHVMKKDATKTDGYVNSRTAYDNYLESLSKPAAAK